MEAGTMICTVPEIVLAGLSESDVGWLQIVLRLEQPLPPDGRRRFLSGMMEIWRGPERGIVPVLRNGT